MHAIVLHVLSLYFLTIHVHIFSSVMCTAMREDAKDPRKIEEGFKINRTLAQIKEIFAKLAKVDENGEIYVPRKYKDYETRTGITNSPITNQDLCQDLSPLHACLRCFTFLLNIIYRLNCRQGCIF